MWKKRSGSLIVTLPRSFNAETMHAFIRQVVDDERDAACSDLTIDFSNLDFIEPVGVVILSNLIEYFTRLKIQVGFAYTQTGTQGARYLDDSGFFLRYLGRPLRSAAALRKTTLPLQLIHGAEAQGYLLLKLMPWIAETIDAPPTSLASLRACLEELFQNVVDHSGVDIGCAFGQHFPREKAVQFALSDFGEGIPTVVRRVAPDLSAPESLRMACREGFTTRSRSYNRGAGLPNLLRLVTQRIGGAVLIVSGWGTLSATYGEVEPKITARSSRGWYPGTLVRVILPTDRLSELFGDIDPEDFSWN